MVLFANKGIAVTAECSEGSEENNHAEHYAGYPERHLS